VPDHRAVKRSEHAQRLPLAESVVAGGRAPELLGDRVPLAARAQAVDNSVEDLIAIAQGEEPYQQELSADGGSVNLEGNGRWYFRAGNVAGPAVVRLRVVDARNLPAGSQVTIQIST
jgi:hypothetical protein